MFKNKFYYQVFSFGKRCENIKEADFFFRNYPGKLTEMETGGLGEEEQYVVAVEWMKDAFHAELSAKGFEWYLLQECYHYAGEVFLRIGKAQEGLYCKEKEFQCGVGLLSLFHDQKDERKAFSKQVILGRALIKCFQEKTDWDKAFYYTNAVMDYLISAKGIISDEEIDSLYEAVIKDRQEISEKMKK